MKTYKVLTLFIISGVFEITAASEAEAQEKVNRYCGITAGRNIYSTLPEKVKYRFDNDPVKEITKITTKEK